MTNISLSAVHALAKMCQVSETEEEALALQSDISRTIAYVEQLSELNTDGVEPTYRLNSLENVWRKDEIQTGLSGESLVSLAPSSNGNAITVPKVL